MTDGTFASVRYSVKSGVAAVVLHRPDRLNAFTQEMARELVRVSDLVGADDEVKAVILTGSGRAFCAGADLEGGASSLDPVNTGIVVGDAQERHQGHSQVHQRPPRPQSGEARRGCREHRRV